MLYIYHTISQAFVEPYESDEESRQLIDDLLDRIIWEEIARHAAH